MTFDYLLNFAVAKKSDKHRTTEAPYENVHHHEAVNPQKIWETWGTFSEKILDVLLKICVVVMKTKWREKDFRNVRKLQFSFVLTGDVGRWKRHVFIMTSYH